MKKILLAAFIFSCNTPKNVKTDFEVKKNEIFEIQLEANHTTGYSWKLKKDKSDKLVDSIHVNYFQNLRTPNSVGVGGKEIWKFKGNHKGIDTLTFEYCRSWEPNSTVETKKITIQIN